MFYNLILETDKNNHVGTLTALLFDRDDSSSTMIHHCIHTGLSFICVYTFINFACSLQKLLQY